MGDRVDFAMLVILNDTVVNKDTYCETLRDFLIPRIDRERHIFMQNGAKPHTARQTMDLLQKKGITVLDCPPPKNPIENLWARMKERIDVDICATVEELEKAVRNAWDSVTQSEINDLCLSFHHRVRKKWSNEKGSIARLRSATSDYPEKKKHRFF